MTDYSHLVTDDHRQLDGAANRGTPYDVLELKIDEDGAISLGTRTYYGGDGTPVSEWHGRTLVYSLSSARGGLGLHIDLDKLRDDLREGGWLSTAIDTIRAGHSVEWDGSNMVGKLTKKARAASERLSWQLDNDPARYIDDSWSTWMVGDWCEAIKHEITADMTDEALAAWVADIEHDALADNVHLVGDVETWAREVRQEKRDDAAADADQG